MATRIETEVRVARWGNSLAIRIPSAVAKAQNLKEGDTVRLLDMDGNDLRLMTREDKLARLERLRRFAVHWPADYRFDREEANARGSE